MSDTHAGRHSIDADPTPASGSTQALVDEFEARSSGAFVEDFDANRMVVNMGPQHPSTHGVLRLTLTIEGEIVRDVKPVIGYLHTGMEKECEDSTWRQAVTIVTRMDYLAPFFNELNYSLGVEKLLGIEVPPRGQAIRVLMTELNRIASHIVWLSTQGMDMGAVSVMLYGFRERELLLDFFEMVTGLRMNHNYIIPGGVWQDLPDGWRVPVEDFVSIFPGRLKEYEGLLTDNPIWRQRTRGVAVISRQDAIAYGGTGPLLRATGVKWDIRKAFPYSGIENYEFDVPTQTEGDVFARYLVRLEEMRQSLGIVKQVLATMPSGDYKNMDPKITPPPRAELTRSMEAVIHHFKLVTQGYPVPAGDVYTAIESPRGELGCYIASNGETLPYRVHVRDPSFANLQCLPVMMRDTLIADTVAAIASVDPVLGGVDR
ncbi:MAG TPA: NADH dehydrogenase (quinone) subunit D [Actinomycetota bacterium]|nr:NADH dehydrogenase (quinone) subunit D [Actinomycetota bacterium]